MTKNISPTRLQTLPISGAAHRLRVFTLLVLLFLQCGLYGTHLGLLPMWGDEAFTVETAAETPARILQLTNADIHPPLYFLLAHAWNKLPLGADALVRLRALSVLFAILTTVLLDRLWLRGVSAALRNWFLLFWILSPCLLLYSRMARSYSMQIFLTVAAVWFLMRWTRPAPPRRDLAGFVVALVALLYTHYLPGIALWMGANVLLLVRVRQQQLRWKSLLLPNLLVTALSLPWLIMLIRALVQWQRRDVYRLTGSIWAEQVIKVGYWFYSFAFGESIPMWLLPVTLLLALLWFWLLVCGARTRREWLWPAVLASALAFLGATGWVSYAFVSARLIFLLPLFLLALAAGVVARGTPGIVLALLFMTANLVGVRTYYGGQDFLNTAYLVPSRVIASQIVSQSSSQDTVVWIDELNFDGSAVEYYLPANFRIRWLTSPEAVVEARSELSATGIRHVWFVGTAHDNTPEHMFEQLTSEMTQASSGRALYGYVPLSPLQRTIRQALARLHHYQGNQPPQYVYELWEFRTAR